MQDKNQRKCEKLAVFSKNSAILLMAKRWGEESPFAAIRVVDQATKRAFAFAQGETFEKSELKNYGSAGNEMRRRGVCRENRGGP